jgi:hypothetical protein
MLAVDEAVEALIQKSVVRCDSLSVSLESSQNLVSAEDVRASCNVLQLIIVRWMDMLFPSKMRLLQNLVYP